MLGSRRLDEYHLPHRLVDQVDLEAALAELAPNDFLPPRPDDDVRGPAADRLLAALRRSLIRGDYQPEPAVIVPVAKWKYSTRPAALMGLADRVVYHALVQPLRCGIEATLVPESVLHWPRGTATVRPWSEFASAPLAAPGAFIVKADIAGFFETIDHDLLHQILVSATAKRDVVDALLDFLGRVMVAPRGLPLGQVAGNALAAAYLSGVDAHMWRTVGHYWRYSDDIVMAVPDRDAGRRAINDLEQQLRGVRLLLHAEKTGVLSRESYRRHLTAVDDHLERLRCTLRAECGGGEPSTVEVAAVALRQALDTAGVDPEDALADNEFRAVVDATFAVLLTVKHPFPVAVAPRVIQLLPDRTRLVAHYLREVAPSCPAEVATAANAALTQGQLAGFQQATLLSVLREVCASDVEAAAQASGVAGSIAESDDAAWLARVEAVRLLAHIGGLGQLAFEDIWQRAPAAFRVDLLAALTVAARGAQAQWAMARPRRHR